MNSSALASPITRGNRCVPPPPGKMPTRVSGRPMASTPGAAMRRSQARLISNPPPMQRPLIAAITGLGAPAIRSTSAANQPPSGGRSAAGSGGGASPCRTSLRTDSSPTS